MNSLKIFVLAFIQAITELLPISSSGHLLLFGETLNLSLTTLLLTTLHFGTTLAILIFFRKSIFKDFLSKKNRSFLLKILLGSIPVAIIGLLFSDLIEKQFRSVTIIATSLIVWGIFMIILERKKKAGIKNLEEISFKQSFLVGCAQSVALIPGTSRSGITTIAGMLVGLDKYLAFEFGLLLGIPVLLGSSFLSLIKDFNTIEGTLLTTTPLDLFIILLVPFVVGYIALTIVSKSKKNNWLTVFGVYRIFIGITVLVLEYWP